MNNLMTRKIILGLLMTCVLVFGVQGVVEAITNPNAEAHVNTINLIVHDVGDSLPNTVSITITPDQATKKETVTISKSAGITFTGDFYQLSGGLTENVPATPTTPTANVDDFTYTTGGRKQTLGDTTLTIPINFKTKGVQWVKISATDNDDTSGTFKGSWSATYTFYVKGPGTKTTTVALKGLSNGYRSGLFTGTQIEVHTGDSSHYDVTYTTEPGFAVGQIENTQGALVDLSDLNDHKTSSAFDVWLTMNVTRQVNVKVKDSDITTVGTYILGTPRLTVGYPDNADGLGIDDPASPVRGSKAVGGRINEVLSEAFNARVTDQNITTQEANANSPTNAVPGVVVTFRVSGGGDAGGYLVFDSANAGTLVSSSNRRMLDANSQPITKATETVLYIRTDENGRANVGFQLGTNRKQDVTISAVGQSKKVSAYAGESVSGNQLVNPRSVASRALGRAGEYELRVKAVDEDGDALSQHHVEFRTSDGDLEDPSDGTTTNIGRLPVRTDTQGIAFVFFDPKDSSSSPRVTAHLFSTLATAETIAPTDTVVDDVVFNIGGTVTRAPTPTPTPTPDEEEEEEEEEEAPPLQQRRLSIGVTGTGATRSITVTATDGVRNIPGVTVTLRGSALTQGSQTVTVGTSITITLPTAPGDYRLEASASGFTTSPIETITVAGGSSPGTTPGTTPGTGTLTVVKDGAQTDTQQPIRVRATPAPSRNLRFTVTRDDVRVGIGLILTTGTGIADVTVPTTGSYVLTVSADGYTSEQVRFTAGTGTSTPPETRTSPETSTSEPSRIEISGSATHSGTVNTELDDPLRVRVLDDDNDPVGNARVIFRVRSGQGRLSQRGNGRATSANTNSRGYADVNYTPLSASSTVSASVNGVPLAVTFTITTGSAAAGQSKTYKTGDKIPISLDGTLTFRGSRTLNGTVYRCVGSGECVVSYGTLVKGEIQVSTVTTPGTGERPRPIEINPMVRVNAANRPPMLWVDGGAIYALVGASVQKFAPGVDNALNIAVGGGKVYWTEKTGESGGTINSANLNGTGVTELASIFATPIGIAVDTDASKLYWTNSAGRIQSANLDGSRITNELQNLESPMDIALAGGNAYWTQGGNVRFVNLKGQKVVRNVSTGTDAAGSLAIGGGKVYWTEKTGESGGTVNSANLNGTGATQLASILAAPIGIAVDTARSKLYWTNSRGRIQSANLDGSKIQNVVDGLGSPGEIVLSNSIAAPTTATTPTDTTSTTTASNKYDVNGDGSVDSKDVDVILLAVSAGVTTAKYDVNGDGKVDVSDVMAVNGNLDKGAAGAPTLLGTQFSALEISRLQEQIDLLIATGDRSPAAMRTLVYLQQLIVMARPEKTQLLANYPNPFNPETWIPYELATDTNVKITIYNTQGVVIRTLEFGHQSAGYYVGRDRAAYWDGRNAFGEQVASGLYFYQLETDEMSSMRKMVILK